MFLFYVIAMVTMIGFEVESDHSHEHKKEEVVECCALYEPSLHSLRFFMETAFIVCGMKLKYSKM